MVIPKGEQLSKWSSKTLLDNYLRSKFPHYFFLCVFEGGTSEEEMMRADVVAGEVRTNLIGYFD